MVPSVFPFIPLMTAEKVIETKMVSMFERVWGSFNLPKTIIEIDSPEGHLCRNVIWLWIGASCYSLVGWVLVSVSRVDGLVGLSMVMKLISISGDIR